MPRKKKLHVSLMETLLRPASRKHPVRLASVIAPEKGQKRWDSRYKSFE